MAGWGVSWIGVVEQRHVLLHEDAVVDALRLGTEAYAQCIGLLGVGAGALVHPEGTAAVAEGVATDARAGIHRRGCGGVQALADQRSGACPGPHGEGAGVGLLLLVTGCLVDRQVAP